MHNLLRTYNGQNRHSPLCVCLLASITRSYARLLHLHGALATVLLIRLLHLRSYGDFVRVCVLESDIECARKWEELTEASRPIMSHLRPLLAHHAPPLITTVHRIHRCHHPHHHRH
jgi:hypothetical protein